MTRRDLRPGFTGNAWLLTGGSALAVAVLVLLLWTLGRRGTLLPGGADRGDEGGGELVLYCAAGLIKPVEEVQQEYERAYHVRIQIEPDGSGKLVSKMRLDPHHADLFLSADAWFMDKARAEGLVAETIPVAVQHPVLAVQPGNPKKVQAVKDLLRDDVKVALANPETTAVGRASKQAIRREDWAELERQKEQFRAKVSDVGTVNEAAQAVRIGAADAAVVWDATARQYGLESVEPEEFRGVRDHIVVGVAKGSRHARRALHFARYLAARDKGLTHFQKHYYEPIADADPWADRPEVVLMTGAMLRPALEQTLHEFEEREGVAIKWVDNGCGILTSQIKKGEVPAAFFACDVKFMDQVQAWFHEPVTVAENDLVILVKKGNPKGIRALADLEGKRVGLAHPEDSALGELTRRLLERQGLGGKVKGEVDAATGHDLVNQLRLGPLDAVVVYRSNALAHAENLREHFDLVELGVPAAYAVQPFAVAKECQHQYLMRRLLEAIRAPESRQRFRALGFRWAAPPTVP